MRHGEQPARTRARPRRLPRRRNLSLVTKVAVENGARRVGRSSSPHGLLRLRVSATMWPPGRVIRASSAKTAAGSTNSSVAMVTAAPAMASGSGRRRASARMSRPGTRAAATASIPADTSTPSTVNLDRLGDRRVGLCRNQLRQRSDRDDRVGPRRLRPAPPPMRARPKACRTRHRRLEPRPQSVPPSWPELPRLFLTRHPHRRGDAARRRLADQLSVVSVARSSSSSRRICATSASSSCR